jgi:endonuclease YncB( thermonuclease family)
MQKLIATAVAAAALLAIPFVQIPSGAAAASRSDPVLVRAVVDGDTIDVAAIGRVRLLGIDAPEIGRGFDTAAPFGREARDRLSALVLRRWVRLEYDAEPADRYDRRLAYVMTETGEFVNAILVREGLARVTARLPLVRLAELKRAEAEAQTFRRGMWGGAPQIPSASYTRRSGARRSPAHKHTASRARKKKQQT